MKPVRAAIVSLVIGASAVTSVAQAVTLATIRCTTAALVQTPKKKPVRSEPPLDSAITNFGAKDAAAEPDSDAPLSCSPVPLTRGHP